MTRGKVSLEGLPATKYSSVSATEQARFDALQMGCLFHALVTVLIKKIGKETGQVPPRSA